MKKNQRKCLVCSVPFTFTRRDKVVCSKLCNVRKWQRENKEKHLASRRRTNLKARFGISVEEYDRLFEKQGGACLCGRTEESGGNRLAVDHDHKTKKVRGLLCFRCNTVVGKVGEDPRVLKLLAAYLVRGGV